MRVTATEGVTLSGAIKCEDCLPTALWRIPPTAGAEGAKRTARISQAKGQSCFSALRVPPHGVSSRIFLLIFLLSFLLYVFFAGRDCRTCIFLFILFIIRSSYGTVSRQGRCGEQCHKYVCVGQDRYHNPHRRRHSNHRMYKILSDLPPRSVVEEHDRQSFQKARYRSHRG